MTTAVLLDHVSAYAAAVRAHLSDLSPEQVEDLTDGLEADLAEALEDREGPVVTGEIPLGRAPAAAGIPTPPGASLLDLTRRFGPAAAYAAELRAAAGLGPARLAPPRTRPRPFRLVRDRGAALWRRWRDAVGPVLATPAGRVVVEFVVSLRPLWWLVRGWVWFVLTMHVLRDVLRLDFAAVERFVPRTSFTWLVLIGLCLASIAVGRGLGRSRRWSLGITTALNIVAIVAAPICLGASVQAIERQVSRTYVDYVEIPVEVPVTPSDGVYVGGMQVSNLFVYDADGNPLDGVQIFDDRGRPVLTVGDDGYGAWELPGVVEPWSFAPARDADGRDRWNVYPLMGAPHSAWIERGSERTLVVGERLRTPPPPFAKAPAVDVGTPDDDGSVSEDGTTTG